MWLKGLENIRKKKRERKRTCVHWKKFFYKKEKKKEKKNVRLWKMENGEKKKNSNINNKGRCVQMVFGGYYIYDMLVMENCWGYIYV